MWELILFWHFKPARVKSKQPKSYRWLALLTACAFNGLGQYAAVLVTGPTVMQYMYSLLLSLQLL